MSDPIEFENVHRAFGERSVLAGLTFRVRPGEVYALLGRNGSGKTTAMNVLLGFLLPQAGVARLLGCDSRHLDAQTRERVGYVSEGHQLYCWMRVDEVLAFEEGTRRRFRRSYVEDALRRQDLPRSQRVRDLSRGQRARLALVIALAGDPEVLVLDDPALGLDVAVRRELLDAMIDLLSNEGKSVLFSTHVLSDVQRIADRVGILHEGRLIVDATLDDLRRRVQRRFLRHNGSTPELGALPGVLCTKQRSGGTELTLLDWDPGREAEARTVGFSLSEPTTPDLEELFLDLTASAPTRAER